MTVWRSATVSEQTAITATSRPGLWMVALLTPDVARALIARGWFMDGELVLDVDDPFLGEHNRYLLTVRGGKADCVPTEREPDLSLDVSDLGSVYLGGTAPSTLVRAGHIRAHHQCAAAPADALFRIERAPTACTGSDRPHPLHNARARQHPDMQPMGVRFGPVGDPLRDGHDEPPVARELLR